MNPLIIGIAGGSGSGKTRFIETLKNRFDVHAISVLSMDNYYKSIDQQPLDPKGIENFDQPDSLDKDQLLEDILKIREGKDIEITEYTFNNRDKKAKVITIKSSRVLIVEGIFTFYFEEIKNLLDLKILLEAPEHLMLTRRIHRDAAERGYDLDDVLYRFQHHVMPSIEKYISPYRHESELIIPNRTDFQKAIDVVSSYIKDHI